MIGCCHSDQKAVGVSGLLTVLGSVPHDGSLRRGSVLWCHLANWLGDVADLLVEQQGTSFDETLRRVVSSWLQGTTDCCHGEI